MNFFSKLLRDCATWDPGGMGGGGGHTGRDSPDVGGNGGGGGGMTASWVLSLGSEEEWFACGSAIRLLGC